MEQAQNDSGIIRKNMVPPAESNLGQNREFYGRREREQRAALGSGDKWVSTYFTRGKWQGQ